MNYISNIRTNTNDPEILCFEDVLKQWVLLHDIYCGAVIGDPSDGVQYDNAFFYGEQAHVSMLCSATWMAGGIGLAEHKHKKTSFGGKQVDIAQRGYTGRCDLYVKSQKPGYEFFIEAKNQNVSINPRRAWSQILETLLKDAGKSADETRSMGIKTLSAGFISFYIPKKNLEDYGLFREEFIDFVDNDPDDAQATAWYFLKNPEVSKSSNYIDVGTALFLA